MSESIGHLVLPFLSGLVLGVIYFGGLWLSVRCLLGSERAAMWILVSFVVRNLIVLAGFYLTVNGRWERLLVTLVGFILVRSILITWVRNDARSSVLPKIGG